MLSDFLYTIRIIFPTVLVLSLLVDLFLSSTWNKMYFTSGLPIFGKRVSCDLQDGAILLSSRFATQFHSDWTSSLVFREIEPNVYGFRDKFFEFRFFRYLSSMHGVLIFDDVNSQVVVKGFVNWFSLCFSVVWLSTAVLMGVINFPENGLVSLGFILVYSVPLGISYLIESHRFSKVATFAADEWKRSYLIKFGGV